MRLLFLTLVASLCSLAGMSQYSYHGTTASQYMDGKTIEFSRVGSIVTEESDIWFPSTNPYATPVYSEMGVWGEDRNTGDFIWFVDEEGTGELMSNQYSYDQSQLDALHYTFMVIYSDGTSEEVDIDYYFP